MRRRANGQRDRRIRLRRPDEPVVVLRIEAADDGVEGRRIHRELDLRGLRVLDVVRTNELAGQVLQRRVGSWRLVQVPVHGDGELFRRARVGDLAHFGQCGEVDSRPEGRRRDRTELAV